MPADKYRIYDMCAIDFFLCCISLPTSIHISHFMTDKKGNCIIDDTSKIINQNEFNNNFIASSRLITLKQSVFINFYYKVQNIYYLKFKQFKD